MDSDWQSILTTLGFRSHGPYGAMRVIIEHVEYLAMETPLGDLEITATYLSNRSAGQTSTRASRGATVRHVAEILASQFEQLRPHMREQGKP